MLPSRLQHLDDASDPIPPRYLDKPSALAGTAVTGPRRMYIEPIVMPSLEHCHVPVLADYATVELSRQSRAAFRERVSAKKDVLSEFVKAERAEPRQPHQGLRRRQQKSLVALRRDQSGAVLRDVGQSSLASAPPPPRSAAPAPASAPASADAKMCTACMLEFQYGYDPVRGPKHRHYDSQVAAFAHQLKPVRSIVGVPLKLTTAATFGDRPPLESLVLR